jgi:demethylmenaquinone methyltransferase / 2-methoxy-6-polyprenyl-1,4-benzoquinol methylase
VPNPQPKAIPPSTRPTATPAWTENDLADPHRHADKAAKVQRMFAAIADKYDLNNRLHSFWRDQAWRRHAVRAAAVRPGETVVDVACGTGDLTELFAASPAAAVVGVDFTPEMLRVAEEKRRRRPAAIAAKISYREGDAQNLPFPEASADVASIAFGIRNVADPPRAIREFARILRPGGRLVILEFDTPRFPPFRWLNDFYSGWLMPRTATLIAGDRSGAYRYLPKSVGSFMPREAMCDLLRTSGFGEVSARPLTLGICTCYRAVRRG